MLKDSILDRNQDCHPFGENLLFGRVGFFIFRVVWIHPLCSSIRHLEGEGARLKKMFQNSYAQRKYKRRLCDTLGHVTSSKSYNLKRSKAKKY